MLATSQFLITAHGSNWLIQMKTDPTKCVDANAAANGSTVHLNSCSGVASQDWTFTPQPTKRRRLPDPDRRQRPLPPRQERQQLRRAPGMEVYDCNATSVYQRFNVQAVGDGPRAQPGSRPPASTEARSLTRTGPFSFAGRYFIGRVGARRRHRDQLAGRQHQRGELAAVDAAGVEPGREGVSLQPANGVVPEHDVLRPPPERGPGRAVDPLRRLALGGDAAQVEQVVARLLLERNPRHETAVHHQMAAGGRAVEAEPERARLEPGDVGGAQRSRRPRGAPGRPASRRAPPAGRARRGCPGPRRRSIRAPRRRRPPSSAPWRPRSPTSTTRSSGARPARASSASSSSRQP